MSWGNPVDMNIQNASLMTNWSVSANQKPLVTNERTEVSEHDLSRSWAGWMCFKLVQLANLSSEPSVIFLGELPPESWWTFTKSTEASRSWGCREWCHGCLVNWIGWCQQLSCHHFLIQSSVAQMVVPRSRWMMVPVPWLSASWNRLLHHFIITWTSH